MEVGASASAEEEGGIVVEKGKDEEAKVLEPSDLEDEGSLAGDEGGNTSWLPTPSLVNSREELASLVAQQRRDESLKDSWRKAGKGEEGYCMDNGVLIHVKATNLGRELVRVVVPQQRRLHLLYLGHRGLVAGHFSHNKMRPALTEHFTWPGIKQDIKEYCTSCSECQKKGRQLSQKVPMITTPIIPEPYQRMAWDLVGKMPRTKTGFSYILTVMSLGSRFPYAIPLQRVDAESVAEGVMEVISHTGIPIELLSDQGSVFLSKVMKSFGNLLKIKQLKTAPYHPQSNGVLERWHRCLKQMLRKIDESQGQWDKFLKYCLLAYRATPHMVTVHSPYHWLIG